MPKVSVIIPVYKAETTIERCAVKLFEQTLEDIEYIFIDDCSPDKSMQILDIVMSRYPERIKQSQIVHMPVNSGVAKVRNKGMSLAKGDFIIHCDSDDWPESDMYERMYKSAVRGGHDVVVSSYIFEINGKSFDWTQGDEKTDPISALLNNELSSALWNKLVRRDIIDKSFVFPEDDICEDFLYSTQYFLRSKSILFLSDFLYHFSYNPSSLTHEMSKPSMLARHAQIVNNVGASIGLIRANKGGIYESDIIRQCLFVKNGLRYYTHDQVVYKIWKNTFTEINHKVLFCRTVPLRERLLYLLIYFRLYHTYIKHK